MTEHISKAPDLAGAPSLAGAKVSWVLASPELSGGNRVALDFASLLREAGADVTVLAQGPRPPWSSYEGRYIDLENDPSASDLASQDLVIATLWTTIKAAEALEIGPVAHLCQGYEGWLEHLSPQHSGIEATYDIRRPTLTVSPHLARFLHERFGRKSRVVPPSLDPRFVASPKRGPRQNPPRILVSGFFEAPIKGIETALRAVAILREREVPCSLTRVSIRTITPEERAVLEPDRYLANLSPQGMAVEVRQADLVIFPSLEREGFGLPALEAMASGTPIVASNIPSVRFFSNERIALAVPNDPESFADRAQELLEDRERWQKARRIGLEEARRFRPNRIQGLLVEAVHWAITTS